MNKKIIHSVVALCATIGFSPFVFSYTSLDCTIAQDLAEDGIIYNASNCQGYSLDRTIYRQEVAAIALRIAEKCDRIQDIPDIDDYSCQNIFYDVSSTRPNSWACRSVEILAENDILTTYRRDSYGRSFFQPIKDITKAEALAILMDSGGFEFRGEMYDDWRFTGTGAVNWQKPVMQYAENNDIIPSISAFRPNTVAYRREVFAYAQKAIEHCEDLYDDDFGNNNDSDNFSVSTNDASPDADDWVDLTIRARDGSTTNRSYRGTVEFDVYYRSSSSSSWVKTTSSSYYEIDEDYEDGYTFTSSNDGQKTLNDFIRFRKDDYEYKVVVIDEDDEDIEGYKIFFVDEGNDDDNDNNGDTDNFYLTSNDSEPDMNDWVDLTIRARDGSYTDTDYRGTVEFEIYYRRSGSSSWVKTTSSSYYEIDEDYEDGYTFTSSNDGQKTLNDFIRFRKDDYEYKVVVIDEDDEDIEGYKIFRVGDYDTSECGFGEYESGGNCYACSGRPSNAYYEEEGSCDWTCNSGYIERNGMCEYDTQVCGIGQYPSGNTCYNCTTKPSSAYYTNYGTCDWSCNSGYYRNGNTCVSSTVTCGIGEYLNGNSCQTCVSAPANSYYTTAGTCSWACSTNYYPSGNQCLPYVENCGVGQYLNGNVCVNCSGKPANSLYSQTGTCDWVCDYGYMREGNSCVPTQNYSWYTGNWSTCSASCGNGTQTRVVECRSNIGYAVQDWQCAGTKPSTTQSCSNQACETYSWYTGNWGTCSNNSQSRTVTCRNSNGTNVADWYCSGTKPSTTQSCNSWTYDWKVGNWGTCINDNQDRTVVCERSDGNIVSNSYCNSSTRPATSQSCTSMTYSWYTGDWGICSNNVQSRTVVCKNSNNQTVSDSYCSGTKPSTTRSCSSWTYDWKTGNWGTCINNNQDRTVVCERNDGNIVANSYCNAGTKPTTSQSCTSMTYSWYTGNWGTCSNNSQSRTVTCRNSNGTNVADWYCSGTKPSTTQSCNSWTYSWLTGAWSTCNSGTKTRTVSCERNDGTIVANSNCNSGTRPDSSASCTTYTWYRGDVSTCADTCNTTRTVVCKNSNGQTVSDSYCTGSKPAHVCARALTWVDTNGSQSCNTVCNNRNSCWVEDEDQQACASGYRIPTWGTFNFLYGTASNPTVGGYWVWPHNGSWYCGNTNQTQEPTYTDKNKVIACLCQ